MTWWETIRPTLEGLDEDEDMDSTPLEGYYDEDPYNFNNPMHEIPISE